MVKWLGGGTVDREGIRAMLAHEIAEDTAAGLPEELITVKGLEADGGKCFCGREWRKVEVKNKYADFFYFEPTCRCFPRCVFCGRSLHREWVVSGGQVKECTSCGMVYPPSLALPAVTGRERKRGRAAVGCPLCLSPPGYHLFSCPALPERVLRQYCPECRSRLPYHNRGCGIAAREEGESAATV
jgi:hypothetical protein